LTPAAPVGAEEVEGSCIEKLLRLIETLFEEKLKRNKIRKRKRCLCYFSLSLSLSALK